MADPHGGHAAPAAGGVKASPVRLVILLAILLLLVGALGYDQLVAARAVTAADKALKDEATKNNATGFGAELYAVEDEKASAPETTDADSGKKDDAATEKKPKLSDQERRAILDGSLFGTDDVRRVLKKNPLRIDRRDGYAIEYYCWWGYVPIPRQYISVVYYGTGDNLRYSTHYANEKPPADSLPDYKRPEIKGEGAPDAKEGSPSPFGMMKGASKGGPMMGPGGPGGFGGKGKGMGGKGKRPPQEGEVAPPSEAEKTPPEEAAPPAEATPPAEPTPPAESSPKAEDAPQSEDAAKEATPAEDSARKEGDAAKPATEEKPE